MSSSGGYEGWYVLEQDRALMPGHDSNGDGPTAEMRRSLDFVLGVLEGPGAVPAAGGK